MCARRNLASDALNQRFIPSMTDVVVAPARVVLSMTARRP